ncbi:hypothetical protein M885DRAFT_556925 [Pelagophyceae sp. CCMP2097]|nr:hypothetical protein M885DRAFT_556925 [Pelagophyceae sp. CCMP2097]
MATESPHRRKMADEGDVDVRGFSAVEEGDVDVRGFSAVDGVYSLLEQRGAAGEAVYRCAATALFLYPGGEGHYAFGPRLGGAALSARSDRSGVEGSGVWICFDAQLAKWVPTQLTLTRTADTTATAAAVFVNSSLSGVGGGYARGAARTANGRPVYVNAVADAELLYTLDRCWAIVGRADAVERASSAPTDAQSPDVADFRLELRADGVRACRLFGAPRLSVAQRPGQWSDADFPADASSVGDAAANWVRAFELQPKAEAQLFNAPGAAGALQGAQGDCWLLSAAALVAEFPKFLRDGVFSTDKLSRDGRYAVRLYNVASKKFELITVDDRVPCAELDWWDDAPRPLFSQPQGNELWVLLIEKALAKRARSYAALQGGQTLLALLALTGCEDCSVWRRCRDGARESFLGLGRESDWLESALAVDKLRPNPFDVRRLHTCTTKKTHSDETMFKMVSDACSRNFIVAATVSGGERRGEGLVEKHAYAIVSARQCGKLRFARLRNAWGDAQEWRGDWARGSSRWAYYAGLRSELDQGGDGLFWMAWDDFVTRFDAVSVCRIDMKHWETHVNAADRRAAVSPTGSAASSPQSNARPVFPCEACASAATALREACDARDAAELRAAELERQLTALRGSKAIESESDADRRARILAHSRAIYWKARAPRPSTPDARCHVPSTIPT